MLEWLRTKTQVTAYAKEDVDQAKYSTITDESAKLYSHFGSQYGIFSEKEWE